MKTLLMANPNCIVYDDGEPLGNRGTTLRTINLPREIEWAPGRGGVVLRGHRITVGHVWRCAEWLGWSAGYIAGQYGLEEEMVKAALVFCGLFPECIQPDDGEWGDHWLDIDVSTESRNP
jgi:uncharacterized protein (DUF433 family)